MSDPADDPVNRTSAKRPLKSRLIEFGLWALLSIVTAVVMILLSDKLLPENF